VATGFPLRKFGISAVNPPTEGSIRAEETDLVRSVEAQNVEVGMTLGWVGALALPVRRLAGCSRATRSASTGSTRPPRRLAA
jgi:hypothetical protein